MRLLRYGRHLAVTIVAIEFAPTGRFGDTVRAKGTCTSFAGIGYCSCWPQVSWIVEAGVVFLGATACRHYPLISGSAASPPRFTPQSEVNRRR